MRKSTPRDEESKNSLTCSTCGKRKVSALDSKKRGALAAFGYQYKGCQCPPKNVPADADMAKMFWQLKQTGAGTTFSSSSSIGITAGAKKRGRTSVDLAEGAIIGGTYKIRRLIGAGGMGEVYKAQHLMLNKTCALKVIPPDQVTQVGWQRFQTEAKAIAKLDHINLVRVSDLGIHEGCLPYYAMEFIDGEILANLIGGRGPLPLSKALPIFIQICDGVAYAHRHGIVHRDLKPENVMLERSAGGKVTVKILDFGLVKLTQTDRDAQSLTAVGEVFGSPYYMSPEQCVGGKIDSRTDIYSAGCMLFECLTGRPPFVAPSAVEIMTDHQGTNPPTLSSVIGKNALPESIDIVMAKLLRKDPAERYQSFAELRADLVKVGKGESVQPYNASRTKQSADRSGSGNTGAGRREAGRPRADDTDVKEGKELKPGKKPKGPEDSRNIAKPVLAVSLVALICMVGACAYFLGLQKQKHDSSALESKHSETASELGQHLKPDPEDNEFFNAFSRDVLRKTVPDVIPLDPSIAPFSIDVKGPNGIIRVFHFPVAHSLGRLKFGQRNQVFARGTVVIPADTAISFSPDAMVIEHPELLRRFKSGEIYEIKPLLNPGGDSDALLAACVQLVGVQRLDLINCNDLSVKGIALIDKYQSLRSLRVVIGDSLLPAVLRLSALKKVSNLAILGNADVDPILSTIKDLSNINVLCLQFAFVSDQGYRNIASMPSLDHLYLESRLLDQEEYMNKALKGLSTAPKLTQLTLQSAALNSAGVDILKTFKGLRALQFNPSDGGELQRQALAQALPNIVVSRAPPR